jgi:hypothetical protein
MYLSAILPTDAGNIAQGIQTVTNQSPVPADRAQISSPKRFKPDQGIDPLPSEPPTSSTQTVVQGPPAVVPMQPMATALPKPPEVLGNNPTPLPELVEILPPLLTLPFPLREFDSAGHRQALLQELSRSDIRRIDLFCRDTVRAFERFQAVSRNRGVRLLIEPVALEALRRKRASWFVVYSDGLTAADWAQLLQLLATADKQAELRRPGDGLFDQIVLLPFASAEQRDLLALSGSDLTRSPESRRPEVTAAKDTMGLVLPYSLRPTQGSREVKQYLDARGDRPPGTVAVMLVLR